MASRLQALSAPGSMPPTVKLVAAEFRVWSEAMTGCAHGVVDAQSYWLLLLDVHAPFVMYGPVWQEAVCHCPACFCLLAYQA